MKKINDLLKEKELEIIDNKINMIYSTKDFMDKNYEVIENGCDMIEINVYYDLEKNQFVYEHITQWKTIYKYEDFPLNDFITFLKESTWGFDSWFEVLYNDALDGSEVYEKVKKYII